jgi:hypothetical protein
MKYMHETASKTGSGSDDSLTFLRTACPVLLAISLGGVILALMPESPESPDDLYPVSRNALRVQEPRCRASISPERCYK